MNNPRGSKQPEKPCRIALKNCANRGIECHRCNGKNKFKLKRERPTTFQ